MIFHGLPKSDDAMSRSRLSITILVFSKEPTIAFQNQRKVKTESV